MVLPERAPAACCGARWPRAPWPGCWASRALALGPGPCRGVGVDLPRGRGPSRRSPWRPPGRGRCHDAPPPPPRVVLAALGVAAGCPGAATRAGPTSRSRAASTRWPRARRKPRSGLHSLRLPRRSVIRRLLGRGEEVRLEVRGVLYVPTAGPPPLRGEGRRRLRAGHRRLAPVLPATGEGAAVGGPRARAPCVRSLVPAGARPRPRCACCGTGRTCSSCSRSSTTSRTRRDRSRRAACWRKRMRVIGALSLSFAWLAAAAGLVVVAGESKRVWLGPLVSRVRRALRSDPHVRPAAAVFMTSAAVPGAGGGDRPRPRAGRLLPAEVHVRVPHADGQRRRTCATSRCDRSGTCTSSLPCSTRCGPSWRACTARPKGTRLVRRVDAGLYAAWGLVSSALAALVCLWLCRLRGPRFAVPAALLFVLHPALGLLRDAARRHAPVARSA